jgi:TolB protein
MIKNLLSIIICLTIWCLTIAVVVFGSGCNEKLVDLKTSRLPSKSVQLTFGAGNDTEAAWSPDGKSVVFQSDRSGTLDLYILDLQTQKVHSLIQGPGYACFPGWSPDGKWIVYSYRHFTKTAFEGIENGYNLFVVSVQGGKPRRLTRGRYHDYCPTFSCDGKTIYFTSTRKRRFVQQDEGFEYGYAQATTIFSIPFETGPLQPVSVFAFKDNSCIQPDFSANGQLMAYGSNGGFRDNWTIHLANTDNFTHYKQLTDMSASFYGPRWSPTEPIIACTGFQLGDSGWNVYLIDANSGEKLRLTVEAGNARSPAFSPDGKQLVYENNQSGYYKLYLRTNIPVFIGDGNE